MEHKNDKTIEIILAVSNLDRENRQWIFPTLCVKIARLVCSLLSHMRSRQHCDFVQVGVFKEEGISAAALPLFL
jgi:hypothetical protein